MNEIKEEKINLELNLLLRHEKRGDKGHSNPWNSSCLSRIRETSFRIAVGSAERFESPVYPVFRGLQRAAAAARKAPTSTVQLARYANSRKRTATTVATHRRKRRPKLSNIQEPFFPLFALKKKKKKNRSFRSCVFHGVSSIACNFTLANRANTPCGVAISHLFRSRVFQRERYRALSSSLKELFFPSSSFGREREKKKKKRKRGSDAFFIHAAVCKQPDFRLTFPSVAFFPYEPPRKSRERTILACTLL